MRVDYDVNQPMEVLIEQIEDAVNMAATDDNSYSAEQVVTVAYNLVLKTGMFVDDCKLWRRRGAGDKTWQKFKTYFTMAHQELRKSYQTSQGAGYHAANNAFVQTAADTDLQQETADAIANLATADRATVATLIETNSKLAQELITVNSKLVIALESNKRLTSKLGISITK